MHARLTEFGLGVFNPPVVRTVSTLVGVKETVNDRNLFIEKLTPAERRAVGWFDFVEEGIDNTLNSGAPVDTLNGDIVNRTYPNKSLKPAGDQIALRLQELEAYGQSVGFGGMIHNGNDYTTIGLVLNLHALLAHNPAAAPDSLRTLDGSLVPVNPAGYRLYVDALAEHLSATQVNQFTHQAALLALTDPQAVIDYDITTGWPINPVA